MGIRMNEDGTTTGTDCAGAWGERMRQHLATPYLLPLRPGTALEDIARNARPAMGEARDYLAEITQDEAGLRGRTVLIVEGTPLLPFLMARRGARVTVSTRSARYAKFLSACAKKQRVEASVTILKGPFEVAISVGPFDLVLGSAALYTPAVEATIEGLLGLTKGRTPPLLARECAAADPVPGLPVAGVHGAPYVDPPYAASLARVLQSLGYGFTVAYTDVGEPAIYPTLGDAVADCAARMGGVDTRGESHLRRALRTALTMHPEGLRFRGTYRRAHIVIEPPGKSA